MSKVLSIAAGDHRSRVQARRDALVETHLDLVRTIALALSRSLPAYFDLDDLISAGYLGLIRAATHYRPRLHNQTPFAAYARPAIRGAILDSVRRRAWIESTQPSVDEVAEPRAAAPAYETELDRAAALERVEQAIGALPARLQTVIRTHYGGEQRLPAVGRALGVGKSRASKLHCEALERLREQLLAAAS